MATNSTTKKPAAAAAEESAEPVTEYATSCGFFLAFISRCRSSARQMEGLHPHRS
ncbi:hypothetical protein [Streptomyces hirsutus]|uniref:hypothetical protein n=1 Tax=Streptomyces hirsutus TaxID=35620 RepID=UPI00332A1DA7